MNENITLIVDAVGNLTLNEVLELKNALMKKYGITAVSPAPIECPCNQVAEEQQTEFAIILRNCGPDKIKCIKLIKEVTGLGLTESKALAESSGAIIKRDMSRNEALELIQRFILIQAHVELQ